MAHVAVARTNKVARAQHCQGAKNEANTKYNYIICRTQKLKTWDHRRRMKTEEKAKVVAAALGAELIKFLAALAILHQDVLKNRKNCTRTICIRYVYDEFIPFFKSPWCKIASAARHCN